MTELKPMEKLAIAQAFYKKVAAMVETKNRTNLRGEVDSQFALIYEEMKAYGTPPKTFKIELFGKEVGTYTITPEEPKPEQVYTQLKIVEDEKLLAWAIEYGFMKVDWERIQDNFQETGEVPDGCATVEIITPATDGGGIKSTTLRIKEDEVFDAIQPMLPEVEKMLLEGGE